MEENEENLILQAREIIEANNMLSNPHTALVYYIVQNGKLNDLVSTIMDRETQYKSLVEKFKRENILLRNQVKTLKGGIPRDIQEWASRLDLDPLTGELTDRRGAQVCKKSTLP
jgi:hypothetical protein